MNFKETVMACYDNKEYRANWERLRKIRLHEKNEKALKLFIQDVKDLIWDRIPKTNQPPTP